MKDTKEKGKRSSVLSTRSGGELQSLLLKNDAILSAVPDIIMEVDADKVYTWANHAGLEFFGEDVIGKEASYYFEGEQDTYEKVQPLFNGLDDVIYVESWQRRRDGEKRLLAWWCRVLKGRNGDVFGAVSTARDITEQIRFEERNRLQTYMLESTIESLPHPFYVIDANNYRIMMANKATEVYGTITEGLTCHELTHNCETPCEGEGHTCPLDIVKRTKKPVTLEHIHYDKDGNPRHIEVHGYPILDDAGNVVRMIEYGLDITDRKRAETELRLANRRMKNDLEAAAEVQRSLLPEENLEIRGVRCASAFKPCEELAGDIFNVFQLDEKHLGLYMLDVSGHGVPAALLSVTLSRIMSSSPDRFSLLKQQAEGSSEYHLVRPSEVAVQLNRQFPMDPDKLQYFTLIYGILNLVTFELRYINAGHPGPIYLPRNSELTVLDKGAVPIGVFAGSEYEEYSVGLKSGDRVYLYSDGITEAANSSDDQFGEERLTAALNQYRDKPLMDGISTLVDKNVERWRGGVKLEDDVSILGIEITDSADHFDPGI